MPIYLTKQTANTSIYTLSLHDALPISGAGDVEAGHHGIAGIPIDQSLVAANLFLDPPIEGGDLVGELEIGRDRKSTRLNSSHLGISYAVFCLKKKKKSETD